MNQRLPGRQWLVVSPHSDDAELGLGGTMARARAEGIEIHVLTAVVKGEQHGPTGYTSSHQRAAELSASLEPFGIGHSIFQFRPEAGDPFDLCLSSKSAFVSALDSAIARLKPDTVFLPVPSFHQEHQWVYECGMAACRPTRHPSPIRSVYAYEYPAAGWGPSASWDASRGGVYVDITDTLDAKLRMLAAHVSQMYRNNDALISYEAVKALARFRGIEAGVAQAELLHLHRMTV